MKRRMNGGKSELTNLCSSTTHKSKTRGSKPIWRIGSVPAKLRTGWLLLMLMHCCAASVVAFETFAQEKKPPENHTYKLPVIIDFNGPIDWNNSTYFHSRIARAKSRGADLLIVRIDSPGGLVSESLRIAKTLRDIDWARTIAYVPNQAISGAALLSFGCDEIVLGENASFGDVGMIQFDEQLFAYRYVSAKSQSMLITEARSLAESKNRAPEIAEAMIDKDTLLFVGKDNNKGKFKTVRLKNATQTPNEAAEDAGLDSKDWELVSESGVERFLTLTGKRAVELGLATTNVETQQKLFEHLNADASAVTTYSYNTSDGIVSVLNNPIVTAVLVIVGIIAMYLEFSAPGIGIGGLIALLCAAIFFWSRIMGGTSGMLEVVLFLCGVIFLLMEIFVIPGWGVAGFAGLALILTSAVMAGLDFVMPESPGQWNQLITNVLMILCSGVAGLIGMVWMARKMGSIPVLNRLILAPEVGGVAIDSKLDANKGIKSKPVPVAHPIVSVGDWGVAESVLRPSGRVKFGHESVDVVSEGSFIEPGDQVKVIEINGNRVVVAMIENLDETVGA